jgi:hypothetical protein
MVGVDLRLVGERESGQRRRLVTLRRVVMSVLLAVATIGMYVVSTMHDDSPTGGARSRTVKSVSPKPGTIQPRQTEIFAELDPSYRGQLAINGTTIPDDQLAVIQGLNRIAYTPGEGREVERLPAGLNCAVVRFQPVPGAPGQAGSYRWCFSVQ